MATSLTVEPGSATPNGIVLAVENTTSGAPTIGVSTIIDACKAGPLRQALETASEGGEDALNNLIRKGVIEVIVVPMESHALWRAEFFDDSPLVFFIDTAAAFSGIVHLKYNHSLPR